MCRELALELLTASEVASYTAGHLRAGDISTAELVYRHTEGNALFMVNIVEHLVQQGLVTRRVGQWTLREGAGGHKSPRGAAQLLVRRIEALPSETQRMLEAASVTGDTFAVRQWRRASRAPWQTSSAGRAGGAAPLHRRHRAGGGPDGSRGAGTGFHALYQQVLYERLGTARRVNLHRGIGARLEAGYGDRAGRLPPHSPCTSSAGARSAGRAPLAAGGGQCRPAECVSRGDRRHQARAQTAGDAAGHPERSQRELTLQLMLGGLLIAAKGRASPEVGDVYTRARALCQQGEAAALPGASRALPLSWCPAQLRIADELSQQLLQLAQRQADPGLYGRPIWPWGSWRSIWSPSRSPGPPGAQPAPLGHPAAPPPIVLRWL